MAEHRQKQIDFSYLLSELDQAAKWLLTQGSGYTVWVFEGDLGAGKTTLISAICQSMGVKGHVSSPTFALIHEYELEDRRMVYHMDLYRIKSEFEAIDAGIEDVLLSGNQCFVEWGLLFPKLLPVPYLLVNVIFVDEQRRQLRLSIYE